MASPTFDLSALEKLKSEAKEAIAYKYAKHEWGYTDKITTLTIVAKDMLKLIDFTEELLKKDVNDNG